MLLPPDMRDCVPSNHLVHFMIDAIESVDTSIAQINHRGTGSERYPPAMLLALLVYSYCTGIFSSRQIERSSHTDVAVRFVCANTHPDHDTICTFRQNNGALLHRAFTQILEMAAQCGVLKVGQLTVAIDGTKVLANARKQAAVSYGHDGIPAIFTTWASKSEFGMESGLRSLQLQAPAYCWSQSPPGMMETQTIPFDEDEAPMTECRPCKNQKAQIFKNGKSEFLSFKFLTPTGW